MELPITQEPKTLEEIGLNGRGSPNDLHLGLTPEGGEPILTGLGPLRTHDKLMIKQKLQTCEMLTGCEQENRFNVTSTDGEILYWAKENSGCCDRLLCGNIRAFSMTISDQTTNEVMTFYRPLTCQGCCCSALYPYCTQALTVSVNGETVGTVRERATWWNPVYHVFDSVANQVLKVRGPSCHFACGADVNFLALDTEGSQVALITKKWMGCFKEALTDADNFVIEFNEGLPLQTKILIFATTFLIDMMYYEMNN